MEIYSSTVSDLLVNSDEIKAECNWLKGFSYPFPSVLGWLDDIGLPQYKTQFDEGRVDGRMLHYMTVVSLFPRQYDVLTYKLKLSRKRLN